MGAEENKAVQRRIIDEVINRKNLDLADESWEVTDTGRSWDSPPWRAGPGALAAPDDVNPAGAGRL